MLSASGVNIEITLFPRKSDRVNCEVFVSKTHLEPSQLCNNNFVINWRIVWNSFTITWLINFAMKAPKLRKIQIIFTTILKSKHGYENKILDKMKNDPPRNQVPNLKRGNKRGGHCE